MIDVSINSKYGADLEGITRMLTDSLCSSLETFKLEYKQDFDNSLHRQMRATVQQILGEGMGKRSVDASPTSRATPGAGGVAMQGSPPATARTRGAWWGGGVANPNLQQPYYQTSAYGPNM
jgi:hypothetical protein